MYRIINRKYINSPIDNTVIGSVCDIVCDNYDDIPSNNDIINEGMLSGSWLWISNERTFLTLNEQGGYIITRIEPKDWETNWASYYIKNNNIYEPLTNPKAPEWEENKYYYYTDKPSFV